LIVLDTNVISELMKPVPDARVLDWLDRQPRDEIYTTAICEAELLTGVALLPAGRRRDDVRARVAKTLQWIGSNRILPFDSPAAGHYADVRSRLKREGRLVEPLDVQIASICLAYGARVATRNVAHFEAAGVDIIDPWTA